jgi:hypothetical protein
MTARRAISGATGHDRVAGRTEGINALVKGRSATPQHRPRLILDQSVLFA